VTEIITNIEKNLQKAWKDAEKKVMDKGAVIVAKQMLIIDGEPREKNHEAYRFFKRRK